MGKTVKGKAKVKAKIEKAKKKIARKVKCCALLALALLIVGCSTATPASRATSASYDISVKVCLDECVKSATVNVPFTFGDGALASADSSGSTETQTATPTLDIRTKIDARYNDAIAGASVASKGVIEMLTDAGKEAVLELMSSKKSGTVAVTKTDGTAATVKCENGQCSFCEDCTANK